MARSRWDDVKPNRVEQLSFDAWVSQRKLGWQPDNRARYQLASGASERGYS
jgi:hypothetical protein